MKSYFNYDCQSLILIKQRKESDQNPKMNILKNVSRNMILIFTLFLIFSLKNSLFYSKA